MLFKIGYLAKKKFNIPWIADYRDGWTTDNYAEEAGLLTKPVHILNKYFEKMDGIGKCIYNGFRIFKNRY
ncbi:MAG: hypothetical protein IPF72_18245 [Chitinophagaceae bacterium]|nr:hypothetical protein [Chitinophagaceae bacterium]